MASVNKRHQARNEQALQDLLKTVPGNDRCADCQARNPGWASWSLGIFLCVRCGSLHRKLGTHLSKVKSLSMDSWTVDQVENMRRVGNVTSNQKYNPSNTKPPVPLDADEIDAAMERFIRAKYDQKSYMAGAQQPTRTQTMPARRTQPSPPLQPSYSREAEPAPYDEEEQPTPAPKSGRKFGLSFRSASSTFLRSKNKPEPIRKMSGAAAPGKVIGATFGVTDEGMEWKLVQLREMGFPDEKRNSSILKGVNGDLERAIESLVRLGERNASSRRPPQNSQDAGSSNKPFAQRSKEQTGFGVQVETTSQTQARSQTDSIPKPKSQPQQENFWDSLGPATAPLPPAQSLEASFQGMQINPVQQQQAQAPSLFPNSTGGIPQQHHNFAMQAPYQQSVTPPVPHMPQQFGNNPYSPSMTRNPFMASPTQQSPVSTGNPFMNMQQGTPSGNPFLAQASSINGGQFGQNQQIQPVMQQPVQQAPQQQWTGQQTQPQGPYGSQQAFGNFAQQQQQMPQQNGAQMSFNPYQQQQPQQQFYPQQQQQQMMMMPQATGRVDNSGIMALYNYPQLAPQQAQPQLDTNGMADAQQAQPGQSPMGLAPVQRSVTMPVSGNKNPFAAAMSPPAAAQGFGGMDDSGRHSPDAFANLSARFVR